MTQIPAKLEICLAHHASPALSCHFVRSADGLRVPQPATTQKQLAAQKRGALVIGNQSYPDNPDTPCFLASLKNSWGNFRPVSQK